MHSPDPPLGNEGALTVPTHDQAVVDEQPKGTLNGSQA
jgi:hypothetical protein